MGKGFKWLLVIGGILLAVLIFASLFGGGYWGYGAPWQQPYGWGSWMGPGMMGPGMMGGGSWLWGNYGNNIGSGWLGLLITVLFLGLIIAAVIALIRFVIPRGRVQATSNGTDYALNILKDRYAKGEINKEEYEQKRKDLI